MTRLVVIGAGGHGRVVADALQCLGRAGECVILDADKTQHGSSVLGIRIRGGDELLPVLRSEGFSEFLVAIGGLRGFGLRRKLFLAARGAGLSGHVLRHPASVIAESAKFGEGSQVLAGAIVNACASIGENCILNTASVVEHDCRLGADVHVAPRACLAGGVEVGDQVHIGAGAIICENLRIGARSIVGAGAVVIRDVPPDAVVAGVPAKAIRRSGQ
jgi:sugar O-acyltransferase (sialic acid O-acetyltransferase NeuD family)